MSFFPAGFDPRAPVHRLLDLCEIDTADGTYRFIIGTDGVFTDTSGNLWRGSALGSVSDLQSALDGAAPEGSITLSYFQDPDDPDVINQLKALGVDYVRNREIRFFVQVCESEEQLYAPRWAPCKYLTRIMTGISFSASGAQDRSIGGTFETYGQRRGAARRIQMNTDGHAQLTGSANPSLEFAPTVVFETEKLFG